MPSPPLALLLAMLSKAHLTSLSRMSGSMSATALSGLSGTSRSFWYTSSVYSCHLSLMSSASVRSLPLLSFIMFIFAQNVPLISPIFLDRSLVFPFLLFSSVSLHCPFKKPLVSDNTNNNDNTTTNNTIWIWLNLLCHVCSHVKGTSLGLHAGEGLSLIHI